ncbi:AAA family ATPase [Enterobacter sp. ECC-249]|uniref:AAA family ATPase n=1 Tax=Enterobacter TaxID=547 RepID=UPI003754254C
MKITLKNFGPIRSFSIDLEKDFHFLIGQNSIGKSYAITAIYLIVKTLLQFKSRRSISFSHYDYYMDLEHNDNKNGDTQKRLKEFIDSELNEQDVTEYVDDDLKRFFTVLLSNELTNSFTNTFTSINNLQNQFNNEPAIIELVGGDIEITLKLENNKFVVSNIKHDNNYHVKKSKRNRNLHQGVNATYIYYRENSTTPDESLTQLVTEYSYFFVQRNVLSIIYSLTANLKNVHYLPASRSGLYQALSAFGQIIAELSKNRSFLSKKIELPSISEPVSDYFIKLSDIRVVKRNYEDKKINFLAKEIEDTILDGKVEFNPQTKQLLFFPNNTSLRLELSSTSSMVSELAPIVSYLRYVLTKSDDSVLRKTLSNQRETKNPEPKSLIMIEEPEAHLHPEIQIRLTEIFAKLIDADVKLIITSHSNFIFNKVNNLVIKNTADGCESGIHKNNVSSMVFKKSVHGSIALPLAIDELGIEDNNFGPATEQLFEEKMDIYNSINEDMEEEDKNK